MTASEIKYRYKLESYTSITNGGKDISRKTLENAIENDDILYGMVMKYRVDKGLIVNFGNGNTGVIPFEELEYNFDNHETKEAAALTKVGKVVCFKVKSVESSLDGTDTFVANLSRKDAQYEYYNDVVNKYELGKILEANITHVEKYGAFCDIGCGVTALLPSEYLCVSRIYAPDKSIRNIQNIRAILKLKDERGRLIISQKELLGTWGEEQAKFKPGDFVLGTVGMIRDYGIFVGITPNLVGLAEVPENMNVRPGDIVAVYIKSINAEKMKIKLNITEVKLRFEELYGNDSCTDELKPLTWEYQFKQNYKDFDENDTIKAWIYSPSESTKQVKTLVGNSEPNIVTLNINKYDNM